MQATPDPTAAASTALPPLDRLRGIVARLRAPDGCAWDRAQTHASLRTALVEETYEVLAAIDASDDANLREELGDLLLHVVMHAQMAAERGAFDFEAVATEIGDKMIRRHPHVFGDNRTGNDSASILRRWEEIKREEKKGAQGNNGDAAPASVMAGLLGALPALMRAQKAQEKAARVGFDWPTVAEVAAKVREEIAEVEAETVAGPGQNADAVADELGDLLFASVNLARWHKLDAETILQRATDKFVRRFQRIEGALHATGRRWEDTPFEELDALWEQAKKPEPLAPIR